MVKMGKPRQITSEFDTRSVGRQREGQRELDEPPVEEGQGGARHEPPHHAGRLDQPHELQQAEEAQPLFFLTPN